MALPSLAALDRPLHTSSLIPPAGSQASSETFSNVSTTSPSSLFTSNLFLDLVAKGDDETKQVAPELVLRLYNPQNLASHEKNAKYRILVIGGGVTGLTTAWALLDAGYKVTIVSDAWANDADPEKRVTSQIAGALWEYPPAVCGSHSGHEPYLEKTKRWCMISYRIFKQLASFQTTTLKHGIRMRKANFFFRHSLSSTDSNSFQRRKLEEILNIKELEATHNNSSFPIGGLGKTYKDTYSYIAPVIDTDVYMDWLHFVLECKGAIFETKRIEHNIVLDQNELLDQFNAHAIVNAAGISGSKLCSEVDGNYGVRGALIRLVNGGNKTKHIDEAYSVSHDDTVDEKNNIIFIVPRNDKTLILGGIAQAGKKLDLTLDSEEIVKMRKRCIEFLPSLENVPDDPLIPLVQGMRPFRRGDVRLGRDKHPSGDRVVHSYGHGGSGFTLSFGCASDVLRLIMEITDSLPGEGAKETRSLA